VVAAAVVLDPQRRPGRLRDSKLLNPEERARLAQEIAKKAVAISLGLIESVEIDRTDILRATLRAMRRAVEGLRVLPDYLLVDAVEIPGVSMPQLGLVRGDRISASIAAASIVAKVYRDGLMGAHHSVYPEYRFDSNKGYGTPDHLSALRRHGATPLHRTSFRGVPPAADGATPRAVHRSR
jgi:ribonuclease HII